MIWKRGILPLTFELFVVYNVRTVLMSINMHIFTFIGYVLWRTYSREFLLSRFNRARAVFLSLFSSLVLYFNFNLCSNKYVKTTNYYNTKSLIPYSLFHVLKNFTSSKITATYSNCEKTLCNKMCTPPCGKN